MWVRKNQAKLTSSERTAFANAVLALKNSVPSQMGLTNRYDDYVQIHVDAMMAMPGYAHRRPAFLPWHRELLRRFEHDLQAVDPNVTLPYWDWTINQSPDSAVPGSPWTVEFLGGNGAPAKQGQVMTGPFAFDGGHSPINVRMDSPANFLVRNLANAAAPTLPTAANVSGALVVVPYDTAPWNERSQPSFRNRLEGFYGAGSIHNRVHLWVGGTMTGMDSPNDPVFFLHHANIDRLWAQWQRLHPDRSYLPGANAGASLQGQRLNDRLRPWNTEADGPTVAGLLDHMALGYRYDDEPVTPDQLHNKVFIPSVITPQPAAMPAGGAAMSMGMHGPMFELSPEDLAVGGHDPGVGDPGVVGSTVASPADSDAAAAMTGAAGPASDEDVAGPTPGSASVFELSQEDQSAGGHDLGVGEA